MIREFAMPDLGEGLTESELVTWHVAPGDRVELNQVVAEVETAKALVQVPSPFAGVVARLVVEEGTVVPVGAPILAVDVAGPVDGGPEGSAVTGPAAPAEVAGPAEPDEPGEPGEPDRPERPDQAEGPAQAVRTSVLVGYGPAVETSARPRRRARSARWLSEQGTRVVPPAEPRAAGSRPRCHPPVRRLAHDLGVDLTSVPGSGPDGLVTRDDVVAWAQRTPSGAGPAADAAGRSGPGERRVPVTGVRRRTAEAMVASAFTAPHATEFLTVDVTRSLELVQRLREDRRFAGTRVTLLAVVAKAVLLGLRRNPSLNARWDGAAGEIVERDAVHLGVAAATPRGLLVPVVKDADGLDLLGLAQALTALTTAAREGTTAPGDLVGGTTTITNIGVFGVDAGTPILVPGEASILATGAVRRRPWEHEGGIALRSVMTLSVSFDHRVVDGEQASRYLADVGSVLEAPGATLTLV